MKLSIKQYLTNPSIQTSVCVCAVVVGIIAYIYFLNLSVVHVVMRKEALYQVGTLRAEVAQLESRYIIAQHAVTAHIASLEGYREDSKKIFITRGDKVLVLRDE